MRKLLFLASLFFITACNSATVTTSTQSSEVTPMQTNESIPTISPVNNERTAAPMPTLVANPDDSVPVPICSTDQKEMVYKEDKVGSTYSQVEACKHHTFGTDRMWYQDYNCYWYCEDCGEKQNERLLSVAVKRECFGHDY